MLLGESHGAMNLMTDRCHRSDRLAAAGLGDGNREQVLVRRRHLRGRVGCGTAARIVLKAQRLRQLPSLPNK
jgi:hypothetical protein